MQDKITVNGVPLNEYLNENESVSDEEKRTILFENSKEKVFNYHKSRQRFVHHELNGKVRHMNKFEINCSNFENELKLQFKENNLPRMAIAVMMVEKDILMSTIDVGNKLISFAENNDIEVDKKKLLYSMRIIVGGLQHTELSKYMLYSERKNKQRHNMYKFNEFFKENFTFKEAYELHKKKLDKSIRNKIESVEQPFKPQLPQETASVEKPQISLKSIPNIPGITIQGDIHIHIHIHSK